MTKYTLELNQFDSKIEMKEFDNIAQIFVDGELVAEYQFGGAGCSTINHIDPKQLINTMVAVLYDQAEIKVEK